MLEWRYRNKSTRETHSLFGLIPATKRLRSRHCFLSIVKPENSQQNVLDAANGGRDFARKLHYYSSRRDGGRLPFAAKHKERSVSSTQATPHVLVEEKKKPRHTCYCAQNLHITALWLTILLSMM